jgi:hypothetical protein
MSLPSASSPTRSGTSRRATRQAGWVHVLTPATVLELCPDAPTDLCRAFAPAYAASFDRTT